MKLQILIPQYDEDDQTIAPLLQSIALQQGIDVVHDVGVIIVNDGSKARISTELLDSFPFNYRYIMSDHKGVSAARNTALKAASADYVMFCDADDMFMSMCGLYVVFREMAGAGFNVLMSAFVEETRTPDTKERVYVNHDMDQTFVHGKVFNRKYLLDNGIYWNENLTIHEDSYFNALAQKLTPEVKYCAQPFYLWKWRDNSVCRHDPKYILKTYNNMIDSMTALSEELIKRGKSEEAKFYVTSIVYDAYYMMNKDEWLNQENQEYRTSTEKYFKAFYEKFRDLIESASPELRNQIIMGMKNRFFGEGVFMESVTFGDWMAHIQSLN